MAARDLQECLLLQLRHLGLEGTPTEKIVADHLRLLQNHQVPEIARKLGLTIDDLKEHIEVIRHLDPKPGSRYNPTQSQYVIPDVYVVKVEDQYVAVLNEDGLPQMRISPVYRRLLDKGATDNNDETRAYVKDKFRSALWLIKSVEQRQKTIHKVANSIINFQREFLDHGIEHLRPLVLRDVANDIGMHESTVSRVVTNKYMHTPQGVFEMKYFFHSGISSSYGESVSSVTIKQRIRKIIENEDPRKPLSDSKIVSILQREGLVLARRTIAKYREELKIPTSNQRKVLLKFDVNQRNWKLEPKLYYKMRLELTGRHVDITPTLRRIVDSRLGQARTAAERQRGVGAGRADARENRLQRRDHAARAGREVPARRRQRGRLGTSLAQAVDKIAQQAQKVKGKWQERKRHGREGRARRPAGRGRAASPKAVGRHARRGCRDFPRVASGGQADVGGRRGARDRPAPRWSGDLPRSGAHVGQRPVSPGEWRADAGGDGNVVGSQGRRSDPERPTCG